MFGFQVDVWHLIGFALASAPAFILWHSMRWTQDDKCGDSGSYL